jgi:hypothetical protein
MLGLLAAVCAIDAPHGIIPNSGCSRGRRGDPRHFSSPSRPPTAGYQAGLLLGEGYLFRSLYRALRGRTGSGRGM